MKWIDDLIYLFYPVLCPACGDVLSGRPRFVCLGCQRELPRTGYHLQPESPVAERFWGRVPLAGAGAFLHFVKKGKVQRLVHQLKYEGRKDIGLALGRWYGTELLQSEVFRDVELIVPVPLHPRKERKRGYNQAAVFGRGLAETMGIPCLKDGLVRGRPSVSQTTKSRLERFENVRSAFSLGKAERLRGRHVLLVDDVVTTGATLEACTLCLMAAPVRRVSIATIAIAEAD